MICIIDYGAGNLHSVKKAFDFIGVPAKVTDSPSEIRDADKLLVPGVGAFGKGMEALRRQGFTDAILGHVEKGRHILGICLGMQLFLTDSVEMGDNNGLDLIPGHVLRFDSAQAKVPQIGWNSLDFQRESPLFAGISPGTYFYFVHSYFCEPNDEEATVATASYAGRNFCAAIEKNGIFAIQFHPEKSASNGLKVLENFAKL
ncbi:imidazole glycerol phosphate synthase, glutamine amidotransferase subunit [Chloroherpeton thalassium ATCC 35110]|uniref:Imidazole glycerol phosphate synthase subunit HisH n=1 Tax=Chloroherpeton thalassium (strain ATCC 35110 / GB-78) TaxID=517418 RepID=B3QRR0_CHLT3|nr:imidazole glycerol phosphate synthase subunit HisH [Chloroherpeton thalassium]ACF13863.1 imidazole glycerol phosphate synthase, glutamine amidotransferase subunit [Chloroherpeton thalassium ATCC 35110]